MKRAILIVMDGCGAGEAPDASFANQQARDAAWQRWLEMLKKT